MKKIQYSYIFYLIIWFCCLLYSHSASIASSESLYRKKKLSSTPKATATPPKKSSEQKSQSTSKNDFLYIIRGVKDEELKDFLSILHKGIPNPYIHIDPDIWLLKAIDEPKNRLEIIEYLNNKGYISKSFGWFAHIDKDLSLQLPLHKAAYLGYLDIVEFLILKAYVTKYDRDDIMILALKGAHPDMVQFLLKNKIFNPEKLYGNVPSIIPQLSFAIFFGIFIPLIVFALDHYRNIITINSPYFIPKYIYAGSLTTALLILLYLLFNMPDETTEGLGYLHTLAASSIFDTEEGNKQARLDNITKCAILLMQYGANPNQKGSNVHELGTSDMKKTDGITPLHIAVWKNNLKLVKLLIRYGAHVNAVVKIKSVKLERGEFDGDNFILYTPWQEDEKLISAHTPLDYAYELAQQGYPEIYNYLIQLRGTQKSKYYNELLNFLV